MDTDAGAKPARPKITISKETTVITEPLLSDGYPDYLEALNIICGKGVTPENNAAVAFWQAVGPAEIDKPLREVFFKKLGIEVLPEEGRYFLSPLQYKQWKAANGQEAEVEFDLMNSLYDQLDEAAAKPWSQSQYPDLAKYLAANEKPLQILAQGVQRSRYYSPLVGKNGLTNSTYSAGMSGKRYVVKALAARAMLKLKTGKPEDAWQDLLAAHRFARLTQQGPLVIDDLVAAACEGITFKAEIAFIHHANITTAQAGVLAADLGKLPKRVSIADKWNVGERLVSLDLICLLAKSEGKTKIPLLEYDDSTIQLFPDNKPRIDAVKKLVADPRMDWDEAARLTQADADLWVATCQLPSHKPRSDAVNKLRAERKELVEKVDEMIKSGTVTDKDITPKLLAKRLNDFLSSLGFFALSALTNIEDRVQMQAALVQVAFALAAYRADSGRYPAKLNDIAPKYMAEVPKDIFTDKELVYKPEDSGKGYALYSLGADGRDDGGRNYSDEPEKYTDTPPEQYPDDIAIRMP